MNTDVKLLNPVSNITRIRNCIEDYVAVQHPFNLQIGWFMGGIEYQRPDKPDDGSVGYISFSSKNRTSRMKLRTGRYLTRKCGLNTHVENVGTPMLNDKQIRELTEKLNALLWTEEELNNVEILRGPAITEAYENSVGGGSCMTGDCSEYTRLYEVNPTRFGMLVIRSGNDSARAIVHYLDNGRILLGCIYTDAEHLYPLMVDYANKKGWYTIRSFNNMGVDEKKTLVMSGLQFEYGELPYMDVLTEGEIYGNLLTVSYNGGSFSLHDTNGGDSGYVCSSCGDRVHENDVYFAFDEDYCEHCYGDNFFTCECCCNATSQDDGIRIEDIDTTVCPDCASGYYYRCETCDEWRTIDNMNFVDDEVYCEECFDGVAGTCPKCDETFKLEDLSSVNGSEPVCEDCATFILEEEEGAIV